MRNIDFLAVANLIIGNNYIAHGGAANTVAGLLFIALAAVILFTWKN